MCYRTAVQGNVAVGGDSAAALDVVGQTVEAACGSCKFLAGAFLLSEAEVRRLEGELQAQRACAADWEERLRQAEEGHRRELAKLQEEWQKDKNEVELLLGKNLKSHRMLFGTSSEQNKYLGKGQGKATGEGRKTGEGRRRGRAPGTPSHPRTPRPGLPVKVEVLEPDPAACECAECGLPFAPNGERVSEIIEVDVSAHTRRVRRKRMVPTCACPSAREVVPPPVPRLFRGTAYGVSVWAFMLVQRHVHLRPLRSVARELGTLFGLPVAAGTLAGHTQGFLRLFEPLLEAIIARQALAPLAHGDETGWKVHELAERGGSRKCWLWVSLTRDTVHLRIQQRRNAEAAMELFGRLGLQGELVLVADCLSTYAKVERIHEGQVVRQLCWVHMRRKFIDVGTKAPQLAEEWCAMWVERIGAVYECNRKRLEVWRPELDMDRQDAAFQEAQAELERNCKRLFEQAGQELEGLPESTENTRYIRPRWHFQQQALQTLIRHRDGLLTFLDKPWVPLDNNAAERSLRGLAIARKLSFGSFSAQGAELLGVLCSVCATLQLGGIQPWLWMQAYLQACAERGGPPPQAERWLPWGMPAERLRALRAPGGRAPP